MANKFGPGTDNLMPMPWLPNILAPDIPHRPNRPVPASLVDGPHLRVSDDDPTITLHSTEFSLDEVYRCLKRLPSAPAA